MPSIVLVTGDTVVNRTSKIPALILLGKENKQGDK